MFFSFLFMLNFFTNIVLTPSRVIISDSFVLRSQYFNKNPIGIIMLLNLMFQYCICRGYAISCFISFAEVHMPELQETCSRLSFETL